MKDKKLLADLRDLHKQATEERSHYYVGSVVERAIKELSTRKQCKACKELKKLQKINRQLEELYKKQRSYTPNYDVPG